MAGLRVDKSKYVLSHMGIFSDAFEKISHEALIEAGWFYNGVDKWYEMNLYRRDRQFHFATDKNRLMPKILNIRLRKIYGYTAPNDGMWVFDLIDPTVMYNVDTDYHNQNAIGLSEMVELEIKLDEVLHWAINECNIPKAYINKWLL